jgi:hypothetical protein
MLLGEGQTMNQVSDTEVELTAEYIHNLVDSESRRRLGIGGEEMLHRYEHGQLDDPGQVSDLIVLLDLLGKPVAA